MLWNIILNGTQPVYNVGGHSVASVADIARKVGDLTGAEVIVPTGADDRTGGPATVRLDLSRTEAEFGKTDYVSLGGRSATNNRVPARSCMRNITLGYLNINDRGKQYVNAVLDSNRLSRGFFTKRFEDTFAAHHDCRYGLFCNSGTSALQVALAALKEVHHYQEGDEVLVPATTFPATINVVIQNGLKPVFVDVDPDTFNMDLQVDDVTPRTRCVIPAHLFGLPCDMQWIMKIAKMFNLQVIEDSCETMFASQRGQRVGSFGDLACFSTYVNHLIVGGVGGLVTTNDPKLDEICRSLIAHGRDSIYTNIDADDGLTGKSLQNIIERRFKFDRVGYSYRATEMEAAIALSELEVWRENIQTRRNNAALLTRLLEPLRDVFQLPYLPKHSEHSFMMYPIVFRPWANVESAETMNQRDKFLLHLEENGIETRYLLPILNQPVYKRLFPDTQNCYPVSERLIRDGFFIGMHQGLTTADIEYVANIFLSYFPERYMITSVLMGGCGNQMFQYACGLAQARRLGVDLQLDVTHLQNGKRRYVLDQWDITTPTVSGSAPTVYENGMGYNEAHQSG